uniref:Uncharacterized protein n=1 Tax=Loxodonta africana TaxID=9785 RepID=G3T9T6_LOXAF
MGKCLSCCNKDQCFQPYCPEEQVTAEFQYLRASSVTQPDIPPGRLTSHPTVTHRVSSSKRSHSLPTELNVSAVISLSGKRHSLLSKLKNSTSLSKNQSRANFDSQEKLSLNDLNSSTNLFGSRSRRFFSAPRLSVISCYQNATFFDSQPTCQKFLALNEIGLFSKDPSIADTQKHARLSAPEYTSKHFMSIETADTSAPKSIDKATYYQNTAAFIPHPIGVSSSWPQNNVATDIQQSNQLSKDPTDSLYPGSQSHNPNYSAALVDGFSSGCKNSSWFTPCQSITSCFFQDRKVVDSPEDEDKSSAVEIPNTRSPQTYSLRKKNQ